MFSCAICNENIKIKRPVQLRSGEKICPDCFEESLQVATCEECDDTVWASDAVRIDGTVLCLKCQEKVVREALEDVGAMDAYEDDDGHICTPEEYLKIALEVVSEWENRANRRMAERLLRAGWGQK